MIQEYGDRNWSNRPQSASDARADDDGRPNRPTPPHRFCHSAIFHPITPYNVWFFWVSRYRSIILAKKMETFSGRFWEIPGNVRKLELSKTLVDHKNALVFYQAVSGKSSWSFSYRWIQYQYEKTATKHQFISLLAVWREKQGCFFGYFFVWVPIFDPTLVQYFIQIPHIIFCCPLSAYAKWWFEQKKSPHFREKSFVLSYLNYDLSKFSDDFTPFFRLWKTITKSLNKN